MPNDFPWDKLDDRPLYRPKGCRECRQVGYSGRMGIYEVLPITEQIEPLIVARTAASEIKKVGLAQGMKTLREDGWDKVLRGMTTVDEVLRVSEDIEAEED